jgi:hypothetical protein
MNIGGILTGNMTDDGLTLKKLITGIEDYIKPSIIEYYEWYRSQRIETLNRGGCVTCGDE